MGNLAIDYNATMFNNEVVTYAGKFISKDKFSKISKWFLELINLQEHEVDKKSLILRRGEIWTINFGEANVGSELNKIRPCIVVQNDVGNKFAPTTIVVPITSHTSYLLPTHLAVQENWLNFDDPVGSLSGIIKAEQIKVVSKGRLINKIGNISNSAQYEIDTILKVSLGIE